MLIDLKLLALFGLVPISTSKLTALISRTEICSLDLEVELIEAIQYRAVLVRIHSGRKLLRWIK